MFLKLLNHLWRPIRLPALSPVYLLLLCRRSMIIKGGGNNCTDLVGLLRSLNELIYIQL